MNPGALVEASAAGNPAVLWDALLCGILLGFFYDGYRIFCCALGLRPLCICGLRTQKLAGMRRKRLFCSRNRKKPHSAKVQKALLFICDFVFAVCSAVLLSVFFYWRNRGILRWYLFAAIACGFFGYLRTAGEGVMRLTAFLLLLLRAAVLLLYHCTFYPVLRLAVFLGGKTAAAWRRRVPLCGKGVFRGKKTDKTKKEDQLLHKNRFFRVHRILRHHHLSDERADSEQKA